MLDYYKMRLLSHKTKVYHFFIHALENSLLVITGLVIYKISDLFIEYWNTHIAKDRYDRYLVLPFWGRLFIILCICFVLDLVFVFLVELLFDINYI